MMGFGDRVVVMKDRVRRLHDWLSLNYLKQYKASYITNSISMR